MDRGEQVNVGVILSCTDVEFLDVRLELDPARVLALDPSADLDSLRAALDSIARICRGGAEAGPIGALPPRGRFRWLLAPRSTVVEPSPVHTGRTSDPAACLTRLFERLMRTPPGEESVARGESAG